MTTLTVQPKHDLPERRLRNSVLPEVKLPEVKNAPQELDVQQSLKPISKVLIMPWAWFCLTVVLIVFSVLVTWYYLKIGDPAISVPPLAPTVHPSQIVGNTQTTYHNPTSYISPVEHPWSLQADLNKEKLDALTKKYQPLANLLDEQDHIIEVLKSLLPNDQIYRQGVYVVVEIPSIQFNVSSNYLSPENAKSLFLVAQVFNHYSGNYCLEVEGHTDNTPVGGGTDSLGNLSIGAERAMSVVGYLLQANVPKDRLAIVSWGAALPKTFHDKPTLDPTNRRVNLVFAPRRTANPDVIPQPTYAPLPLAARDKLREFADQLPVPATNSVSSVANHTTLQTTPKPVPNNQYAPVIEIEEPTLQKSAKPAVPTNQEPTLE